MDRLEVDVRAFDESDSEAVLEFGLRAFEPVYDAWSVILGDSVYRSFYPDWRASQSQAILASVRTQRAWVAASNAGPVGFVTVVMHSAEVGEIDMLAVDPRAQRQGIGQKLIETALDYMRSQGARRAELGTGGDPGHAAARRAYERAGFVGLPLVHYYKEL
ncbi:MAG: GNAT family N-acetyltransferase [Microbacteriaceae bacterium]|nr:GNAT family N-acetyltransferase [Microbacteriaceae bacterium]